MYHWLVIFCVWYGYGRNGLVSSSSLRIWNIFSRNSPGSLAFFTILVIFCAFTTAFLACSRPKTSRRHPITELLHAL